jgi:ubiquinone/menaquinone biosynthesis C-methylase UbiE
MNESLVARMFDQMCDLSPTLRRFSIRNWYQLLSTLDKEAHMPYMNLGYASLEDEQEVGLHERDEPHRYCMQMYRQVVGTVDLHNQDVLEVGCGRGGGAAYVKRAFQPRSLIGIDIASRAIRFCRDYHQAEGLSFFQGDAEALPFGDHSFDAVINIESSFSYGHIDRFLREVFRVLRPGGYFLLADYREKQRMEDFCTRLSLTRFMVLNECLINAQVIKALELDSTRRTELIRSKVPRILQGVLHDFAGTKDTRMYKSLKAGTVEYRIWTLQKEGKHGYGETASCGL